MCMCVNCDAINTHMFGVINTQNNFLKETAAATMRFKIVNTRIVLRC